MDTITVYRKANVTSAEATTSLFKRFAGAELVGFRAKTATAEEAVAARASKGELVYEATLRLAEFPPKKDASDDSDSPIDTTDDSSDSSSDSDSKESDDSKNPLPFEDKGKGDSDNGDGDSKLKGDAGIIHLLTEILHTLKNSGGLGDADDLGSDAGGPVLPDVGAPDKGGSLPPPQDAPPLPPPVPEKAPVGGTFSHYDKNTPQISVLRRDSGEIGNKAMIAEAAELYPTHKVARIQRTGSALINGLEVNLPNSNAAVVTLVRK